MRSSKSRSRSKSNRNRSTGGGGNVVNRVFDSSGPEGKVRGTPQQIIDKYNQLARDSQLNNDGVAVENFQQHAEHYLRMLSDAQREQEARREEQERQNRERQAERDRDRAQRSERHERHEPERHERRDQDAPAIISDDPSQAPQPDVLEVAGGDSGAGNDTGLVETPESAPKKPTRRPRTRKPAAKAKPDADAVEAPPSEGSSAPEAAE